MEIKIGAVEGEAVDRQTIIDIITHEEEQIAAEKKEVEKRKEEEFKAEKVFIFFQKLRRIFCCFFKLFRLILTFSLL